MGLHQAQHGIEQVGPGIVQTDLRPGPEVDWRGFGQPLAQGLDEPGPCGLAVRAVAASRLVTLVRLAPKHSPGQQPRIGLQGQSLRVAHPHGQTHARLHQPWGARVEHESHGRIDPFHGRTAARREVGGPMGKLLPGRARIAPGPAGGDEFGAAQCGQLGSDPIPHGQRIERQGPGCGLCCWHRCRGGCSHPAQVLRKHPRQSKRKIEPTHPGPGRLQPARPGFE